MKKSNDGIIVVTKPTDKSTYKNLMDALDEMQICSVECYAIVNVAEGDNYLIENYKPDNYLKTEI